MPAKKALILTADTFEDSELLAPMYRLLEAGYAVDVAAPAAGKVRGKHGYEVAAGLAISELTPAAAKDYALLLLPGGKAPEAVRTIPQALELAKAFDAAHKPIAAICHGPQTLVSAGIMKGRTATAYKTVQPELTEAGAKTQDKEVVVDHNLVTSRQPGDIPAFNREMMRLLGA
jgi:protease I